MNNLDGCILAWMHRLQAIVLATSAMAMYDQMYNVAKELTATAYLLTQRV
jgi:hypothetical protein